MTQRRGGGTEPHAPSDVLVGGVLVLAQFVLLAGLVAAPRWVGWSVPGWVAIPVVVVGVGGLALMVVGASALRRGLTAAPLPNRFAELRTYGVFAIMRHPIYTGLLIATAGFVVVWGGLVRLGVWLLLVLLINVKARWEERRLERRFPGYREYAARTPRFFPRPR